MFTLSVTLIQVISKVLSFYSEIYIEIYGHCFFLENSFPVVISFPPEILSGSFLKIKEISSSRNRKTNNLQKIVLPIYLHCCKSDQMELFCLY